MPNGKDPNWKQMIVDIHGDTQAMKPQLEKAVQCIEDHEKRIEAIEIDRATSKGYRKAKDKFYEKHPVKTAVGGSITITTVITVIGGLILFLLEHFGVV